MIYLTEIKAIHPKTGEIKTWAGIKVNASSWEAAERTLEEKGFGYCKVIGTLQDEFNGKKKA